MNNLAFDLSPEQAPWRFRDTHPQNYKGWLLTNPSQTEYKNLSSTLFPVFDTPKPQEKYKPFERFSTFAQYEHSLLVKSIRDDRLERRLFLADQIDLARSTAGFKVNRYLSGEMTGAIYTTGLQSKVVPPSRTGGVETLGFTLPARNKIRRAVENSQLDLKYFLTLTFAPSSAQPWHLDDKGNIRHDYAKYRLTRLFDALQIHCKRKFNESLLYVWVAELQKNGNIHFHVLLNRRLPLEYYRRLWTVGNIDVQYINNSNHAVNYMRKYMTKTDNSLIKGNRYGIASGLRETMKPIEEIICSDVIQDITEENKQHVDVLNLIHIMRDEIEFGGGTVLDFGLWGENSTGFHFTNLLLYLLTIVAVYCFTETVVTMIQVADGGLKQLAPASVAFWTAAFFAVMPIHCEAVSFIGGGRNTLLAAFFTMISCCYFVMLLGGDGNSFLNRRFFTAFFLYILAVLSKASAITLPLFFLGLCMVIRCRPLITRLAITAPFILVSGFIYVQYTSIAIKVGLISPPEVNLSIANKIAIAVQIPFFYLSKFIIPTNLSTDYGAPFSSSLTSPFTIASMVAVITLTLLTFVFRNKAPFFFIAVCWYGVFLIPVLHLLPTAVIVADRYAYLPSFAFCFLLAWFGVSLKMRWPYTITTAAVALFLVYGFLSFQQNSVWRSNLTLWQHSILVSPRSVMVMENLGTKYYSMGEYSKAFNVLYGIQQIEPLNPIYDFFEGKYLWERGDFPRATISFERAIGKKPNLLDAFYYLADICEQTKNFDCAISYFQRLIVSNGIDRCQYKKIAKERLAVLGAQKSIYD